MRNKKSALTRILAIAGTVLVWTPLLAPVLLAVATLVRQGWFAFDYLVPAELFPLVLAGGALLLWAAWRRHRFLPAKGPQVLVNWIGWSLGSAAVLLLLVDVFSALTGLASGAVQPGGWQTALVLAALAGYILAVLLTGVGGICLLRAVFRKA